MTIRIVLADDHQLIRQGVRALLERERFHVVGEASNGREAVDQITALHPDVAVMDIGMPMLNGVDAAQQILRASPTTKIRRPHDARGGRLCHVRAPGGRARLRAQDPGRV